ncbi:MAG: cupin domain-containing protein, partial [Longicatena sp.]
NEMEPIVLDIYSHGQSKEIDPHDGEEFGFVLEGRITLVNGEQELPVKKGETFYINGKYRHYLKNVGKVDAKVLWITTPPLF